MPLVSTEHQQKNQIQRPGGAKSCSAQAWPNERRVHSLPQPYWTGTLKGSYAEKKCRAICRRHSLRPTEAFQIARGLPLPLATLRRIADRYHSKKQQMSAKGVSTKEVAQEFLKEKLCDNGCQTAYWDGMS